ncbi:MAG TPA: Hpt domain-containing protein, partial [Acidiferrobacterales bacterium]|nr:Hpt domain-containing protein [Acidiferrobacterales bacterium]
MALDPNDEILQDLLVSSREILEALDKQLVELEQRPDDKELLNAVFRGFHTIKGGASFLALNSLVAICHHGEDVFNLLRRGERVVTPQLMDVVLRVLDSVNEMFVHLNNGVEPPPADPELLAQLEALAKDGPAPAQIPVAQATALAAKDTVSSGDITDAEFDSLLDALAAGGATPAEPVVPVAVV